MKLLFRIAKKIAKKVQINLIFYKKSLHIPNIFSNFARKIVDNKQKQYEKQIADGYRFGSLCSATEGEELR